MEPPPGPGRRPVFVPPSVIDRAVRAREPIRVRNSHVPVREARRLAGAQRVSRNRRRRIRQCAATARQHSGHQPYHASSPGGRTSAGGQVAAPRWRRLMYTLHRSDASSPGGSVPLVRGDLIGRTTDWWTVRLGISRPPRSRARGVKSWHFVNRPTCYTPVAEECTIADHTLLMARGSARTMPPRSSRCGCPTEPCLSRTRVRHPLLRIVPAASRDRLALPRPARNGRERATRDQRPLSSRPAPSTPPEGRVPRMIARPDVEAARS